jgi:glucosamine--fructose-6-phosphate aminotransferase (isomerizing)
MCGIVGYVGEKKRDIEKILINGLRRLEYRGYDSAGLGVVTDGKICIRKCQGKIKDLIQLLNTTAPLPQAKVGIAHTRWATHGTPNKLNAHPHTDCNNQICIVHNGIIENYQNLKSELIREGHRFRSQTDTEVMVHLIKKYYRGDLLLATRVALQRVRGSFALGIISTNEPQKIIAARKDSPLIIGLGKNENFIASDAPAILEYTKDVIYLEDYQIACITQNKVEVIDLNGRRAIKKTGHIDYSLDAVQKDGYSHFMLKEIFEQPKVVSNIISLRLHRNRICFQELRLKDSLFKKIKNIIIIACGTAYHAGMVGKYVIESVVGIPVSVDLSSEFRYRKLIVNNKNTLVIAISQSGETADTLAAVRLAKQKGVKVLSICNVVGSSLARNCDGIIYTYAGPEVGVASTKAYSAQLAILYLFAFYLARLRNNITRSSLDKYLAMFKTVPRLQKRILEDEKHIAGIATRHHSYGSFLYLGRNINFPTALEGALKLKEISYIPAEGYAAGEMKHGPIALIDEYRAVVCIATESKIYDKMVSNIQEIRARNGRIIAIISQNNNELTKYIEEIITIPLIDDLFSPILTIIPLQLLAYYIAVRRGCDVDQPRNLAKSVTVE